MRQSGKREHARENKKEPRSKNNLCNIIGCISNILHISDRNADRKKRNENNTYSCRLSSIGGSIHLAKPKSANLSLK